MQKNAEQKGHTAPNKVKASSESKGTNNLGTLVSEIHTHSEMDSHALPGFVLLPCGQIQPLEQFPKTEEEREEEEDGGGG